MAIGTPTLIAGPTNGVASGSGVTTTVDAPVGSLIIVEVLDWGAADEAITGVTDSAGNTYVQAVQTTGTTGVYGAAIFYCSNSAFDLPVGGHITATLAGATSYELVAYEVSGCNGGLDKTNSSVSTTAATSASIASGTLTTSNQLVYASVVTGGTAFGTWTEGSGFTTLTNVSADALATAYKIPGVTTTQTYAPSWATSAAQHVALIATFKATPGETGTATLAFGGLGLAAAGRAKPIGTSDLAFAGAAFSAAGTPQAIATATVAFSKVSFSVAGSAANQETGSARLAFGGVSISTTGHVGIGGMATLGFAGVSLGVIGTDTPPLVNDLPWRSRVVSAPLTPPKLDDDLMYLLGLTGVVGGTVAELPADVGVGARGFVIDATSTTFLSIVVGGGSNRVPVSFNGYSWVIG